MNTVYMNQPAVLLSHINEPVTIRTSQPNRLSIFLSHKPTSSTSSRTSNDTNQPTEQADSWFGPPLSLHYCVRARVCVSLCQDVFLVLKYLIFIVSVDKQLIIFLLAVLSVFLFSCHSFFSSVDVQSVHFSS